MTFLSSKKSGFTLIELMVVISVIGLLSSIILGNLNRARQKARDTKRLSDVTEMRLALELYSQDHGGLYPHNTHVVGGVATNYDYVWVASNPSCYSLTNGVGGVVMADGLVSGGYIPEIPKDPKSLGSGKCYMYYVTPDGLYYKFSTIGTVETFNPRASNVNHALRDPKRDFSLATMTETDPEDF
jgi:prepilin-type N-terminal cleavage/methylation domain-containing protein